MVSTIPLQGINISSILIRINQTNLKFTTLLLSKKKTKFFFKLKLFARIGEKYK